MSHSATQPLIKANIFQLPNQLPIEELFETLVSGDKLLIERIISTGQVTSSGKWYDQDLDEWVILLQGEAFLTFDDHSQFKLKAGDYVFIAAHRKHRVDYTSSEPPCIWLAVHGKFN